MRLVSSLSTRRVTNASVAATETPVRASEAKKSLARIPAAGNRRPVDIDHRFIAERLRGPPLSPERHSLRRAVIPCVAMKRLGVVVVTLILACTGKYIRPTRPEPVPASAELAARGNYLA